MTERASGTDLTADLTADLTDGPDAEPTDGPAGAPAPTGPLETGTMVSDRYRLEAPLSSGGMATVWRATDTVLTRPVALKVLHADLAADPEFVARFRREAVAAARLTHPSIVAIYDTADDPEAIVMELVEGRTLREELDRRHFLAPAEAVEIASGVCQAMQVAHDAGIVHRDVKPANILLSASGQLKVADFGIAKAAAGCDAGSGEDLPDLTRVGRMVGTAKYLAPEQVSGGEVDPRTDVYAVGAVLYEMLCGRPPFQGDNDLAVATARLHSDPDPPRQIRRTLPAALDAVVLRALARDPDERYPTADALWAALQSCRLDEETAPPVVDATMVADSPASFARAERSWLVPTLLVTMVAVALGLAWMLIGGTEARRDLLDLVERVAPGGDDQASAPVAAELASAAAFDPFGGDGEHDDEARFAIDGDRATGWTTERYDTRAFGGLKPGVGLIVELAASTSLSRVELTTQNRGWAADIYVADEPGARLEDWGTAAAAVAGADGNTTVDVDDAEGSFVLVWFTDLGTDPGDRLDIREVEVTGEG